MVVVDTAYKSAEKGRVHENLTTKSTEYGVAFNGSGLSTKPRNTLSLPIPAGRESPQPVIPNSFLFRDYSRFATEGHPCIKIARLAVEASLSHGIKVYDCSPARHKGAPARPEQPLNTYSYHRRMNSTKSTAVTASTIDLHESSPARPDILLDKFNTRERIH
jgi:hypothetical protein